MRAYCQGRGASADEHHFVLAGMSATAADWAGCDEPWQRMLAARTPRAPYLDLRELAAVQGPYADALGWDESGRQALVRDALALAQDLDPDRFHSFACTVDMDTYRDLELFSELLLAPEKICNHHVPRRILSWQQARLPLGAHAEVEFTFDPEEPFLTAFRAAVRQNQRPGQEARQAARDPWSLAGELTAANPHQSAGAQLAALLAWAVGSRMEPGARTTGALAPLFEPACALHPCQVVNVDAELLNKMAWARFPTEFLIEGWER